MSKATRKNKATRTTVSLPAALNKEAETLVAETGISISDLLRQGMIRLLLERREIGAVRLLQLPSRA
jgi:hypothetical protein